MKHGEIVLNKPRRHHNASIDGYKIEVVAISISDELRLNAKRVILDGYAYPNKPVWDEYNDNYFGCYIDRVIFSGPMTEPTLFAGLWRRSIMEVAHSLKSVSVLLESSGICGMTMLACIRFS